MRFWAYGKRDVHWYFTKIVWNTILVGTILADWPNEDSTGLFLG